MNDERLVYTKHEGIATLRINRPRHLNAFTWDMYIKMINIINGAARDDDVRVLVITGTGRAFCVGADVRSLEQGFDMRTNTVPGESQKIDSEPTSSGRIDQVPTLIQSINKPVIAAINGVTAGGGLDTACACDIRIASDRATFSSVFVRRGLAPTMGGTYFIPRLVGVDRACELIWTGDLIDAREAERIGLVTRVVPHEDLDAVVEDLAVKLTKGAPLAIAGSKKLIYRGLTMELESAMNDVIEEYSFLSQTRDHREALAAFMEKREPVFKGE